MCKCISSLLIFLLLSHESFLNNSFLKLIKSIKIYIFAPEIV